jgi:Tyrosine phosphatase family
VRFVALALAPLTPGSLLFTALEVCPGDPRPQHPAPGTSIVHFTQVDVAVYRGSTPKTDADFRFLQAKHIRYIVGAKFLPFLTGREVRKARTYGMVFLSVPMNASPVAPSEKHVNHVLLTLRDKRYQPIYFHCDIGRDRSSLIGALYKMYFLGVSQEAAWKEMNCDGFKNSWTLHGLKAYLEKHSEPSPTLMAADRALNK